MAKKKDHCSFSPEGNWGGCCKRHDKDYDNISCNSGTRFDADWRMAKCITKAAPHWALRPFWGFVGVSYFGAVRIFGNSHVKKICNIKRIPVWKNPDKEGDNVREV